MNRADNKIREAAEYTGGVENNLQNEIHIADYKSILEKTSIIAITDRKGIIQYVSENFSRLSQYTLTELIGQDFSIVNSGFHSKDFMQILWETIISGKIWKGQLKNKAKDGSYYWVDSSIVPLLDEHGEPYQYVSLQANITDHKSAEERLMLFDSIMNYSDDAVVGKTLDGAISSWSQGAEKVFGYTEEEIIGKPISLIIPASLRNEEDHFTKRICKGQVIRHYKTKRLKKDGRILFVSLTIFPVKDVFGNITGTCKIVRDITDLEKAEEKIFYANHEKETVLNRITDAVVSVDNDWRYTFLNDAAISTHPLGILETLGKVIWDVHPDLEGTIFWDKYHEAMLTRKVVEVESYYLPMDTWFSVKVYPSINGLTIFYNDVTERKKAEIKLSQSLKETADYKFALDEASIVAITDQKGIIKYVNKNFCKISKYTQTELIGQDHRIINSGYHSKEFIRDIWVTIGNGEIWKGEIKNKAKDGTYYWVDTTIVPFLDNSRKPYQYIAIRADITERKKAEANLVISEMKFRSLIEHSAEGIVMTDEFSNVIYRSPSTEKITGLLPIEKTINNTHPDDLHIIKEKFAEVLESPGIPIAFQGRFNHASGHYIWLEGTFTNLLHVKEVRAIVTNYRDISQRKQDEEKLIKSEKIYKTIASSIPGSAISMLDTDFRYLLIEGDLVGKFGYSKEMIFGNKAEDILTPELFASLENKLKRVLNDEEVAVEANVFGFDLISKFIPLKDDFNTIYAIMIVTIDVTKLKSAERNIMELNRSLEEKILKRTNQLEIVNKELESFSYSVSHDLRAPLRIIDGFGQILLDDYVKVLDEEGKRTIKVIIDNTRKMGQLIDDLLRFSKLGRSEIRISTVNMNELVDDVFNELRTTGFSTTSTFNRHNLNTADCDRNLLKQVWINLISNAIKYSSGTVNPIIEIGMMKNTDKNVFYIRDNGAGFDMQYAHKLFGVFQRLHTEEQFSGTGVGLALVKRIIVRHEGTIWAESEIGNGATFYFTLSEKGKV